MAPLANPALVRAFVADLLRGTDPVRAVALAAAPWWPYDECLLIDADQVALVRPCVSVDMIAKVLSVAARADGDVLVVLTQRRSDELEAKQRIALAGGEILPADRWRVHAHTLLLERAHPDSVSPISTGKPNGTLKPVDTDNRADKDRTAGKEEPVDAGGADHGPPSPRLWVDRVMASAVLTGRLDRMRRGAMPADRLAVLLRLLDSRGGTVTRAALARELGVPDARVASQVAAAARVLNIDGYAVLQLIDDTIRLNTALLTMQTGI